MRNIHITELHLSWRTVRKLRKNGIVTVNQLISKTESQLWNECDLGRAAIDEILESIQKHGFKLKSSGAEILYMIMD